MAALEPPLRVQADRAAHARPPEPAVAVGHLGQVLLVIVLGVEERPGVRDLGRDLAEPRGPESLAERRARALDGLALLWRRDVHRRAVLGPDVVALAHPLRGVVPLPEDPQQLLV